MQSTWLWAEIYQIIKIKIIKFKAKRCWVACVTRKENIIKMLTFHTNKKVRKEKSMNTRKSYNI